MLNKKSTIFIGFVLAALVFAGFNCPDHESVPYSPKNSLSWTDEAKNAHSPDSIYPDVDHADLSAAGISYSGYDESRINYIQKELRKYAADPEDASDPIAVDTETALSLLVQSLLDETNHLFSQIELLNIQYYRDVKDEEISKLSSDCYEQYIAACDRSMQILRDVLKGSNGDLLKKMLSKDEVDALKEYEDMTKKEKRLYREETLLVQAYDKLLLSSDDLKKDNKEFVRIYSDLNDIRRELAQIYEYDTFPEYAYSEIYYRDYDCEDAAGLHAKVKKYIVPLFVEQCQNLINSDAVIQSLHDDSGDEILKNIAPYINDIDPELNQAFRYLHRHHLYDLDASPTKMDTGYTTNLPEYGAAFIFNAPYGYAYDYSTTVHEFGHYNAIFHQPQNALFSETGSYDIAEIHSQALELLFFDYYDELFGEDAEYWKEETLANILSAVVTGCMYDEFQQAVFEDPDMSRKEINDLAAKLSREYGLIKSEYLTKADAPYDWVLVSHTFESPMYYISYATSALSALDIWTESFEDRDAAIEKYMDVTAVSNDQTYLKAIRKCGLRNVFSDGVVKDIAEKISAATEN